MALFQRDIEIGQGLDARDALHQTSRDGRDLVALRPPAA
jgi:hypothetical protein